MAVAKKLKEDKIAEVNTMMNLAKEEAKELHKKADNAQIVVGNEAKLESLIAELRLLEKHDFCLDQEEIERFIVKYTGASKIAGEGIISPMEAHEFCFNNRLANGLILLPGKVRVSPEQPIELTQPKFVNPIEPHIFKEETMRTSFRLADVKTIRQSAEFSWGASAAYSGGVFVGIGVAGWSMNAETGAAKNERTGNTSQNRTSNSTFIRTQSCQFPISTLSLQMSDFDISSSLYDYLQRPNIKANLLSDDFDLQLHAAREVFNLFGTHYCTEIILGGIFALEASITESTTTTGKSNETAMGAACDKKITASAAFASICSVHKGGVSASFSQTEKKNAVEQTEIENFMSKTDFSTYTIGGDASLNDFSLWLENLVSCKSNWRVIDRKPEGLRGIWVNLAESPKASREVEVYRRIEKALKDSWDVLNGVDKGEFKIGEFKNGRGKFKFANGNVYDGEFKNDKMEGRGVYKYASGDVYNGEYKNDKREGRGVFIYASGSVYDGEYKNDEREG